MKTVLRMGIVAGLLGLGTSNAAEPDTSRIKYGRLSVDGISIFYREAGDPKRPTILLLHGFPTSSHMFRELIPRLADTFHVVAPDYPGFGYSDAPPADKLAPTFEVLTDAMEHFVAAKGLRRFSMYLQDFGGPVGLRLAIRHPGWVERLIIQNANAYDQGLADTIRQGTARRAAKPSTEAELAFELGPELDRMLYKKGARRPDAMNPDAWSFDAWAMDQPGHRRISAALLNDYQTNIDQYPRWQTYLRTHHPPTLVVWGKGDPIFLVPGAEAYRRDLPEVQIRYFDTSHFALEEDDAGIAREIKLFFKQRPKN